MRAFLLVSALLVLVACLSYYLWRVHDATPDESTAPGIPVPLEMTRRIAARMPNAQSSLAPPASRWARIRNRFGRCRRDGHTYRVAFPSHRYSHQCRYCGDVRPVDVVTFRPEYR